MKGLLFIIILINLIIYIGLFIYVSVKWRKSKEEIKKMKHDKNIADK